MEEALDLSSDRLLNNNNCCKQVHDMNPNVLKPITKGDPMYLFPLSTCRPKEAIRDEPDLCR